MSIEKNSLGTSNTPETTTNAGAQDSKSTAWVWWVSGLLLLATMLNYMDRQTLSNLQVRIKAELSLSNELYGNME